MTITVDRKSLRRGEPLGAAAMAQLFTEARTHNNFRELPVPDRLLREALDLAKMGPTAANQQPLRALFLRSTQAKERLRPALMPGNVEKTMAAPVVAVMGYDVEFYEHLPFLFPHADAKSWFAGRSGLRRAQRRAEWHPSGRLLHSRAAHRRLGRGADDRV